jgi:hypothetical protein
MKQYWGLFVVLILLSCREKQSVTSNTVVIDVSDTVVIPQHYIATKTNAEIKIDGIPSEKDWGNSKFTSNFIDIEGVKTPKYETKVKILWDDTYLYVYAVLQEPHIWGNIKERDAIIYLNNDFEIFIDPSQTGYGYGEIEINALNTVWDLYLDKPYRSGGKANFQWDLKNLKTAIHIEGSLNNPNDKDLYWAVEMAVPLNPFVSLKNRPKTSPKEGEQWRLNFSRVQWDFDIIDGIYHRKKENDNYLKEYNWVWSNQKVINMHEPEKWGVLQFTEEASAEGITYNQDQDLGLKQAAFALFRKTKFQDLKTYLKAKTGTTKTFHVKYSESDTLKVNFLKTNFGFEYVINSKVTNKTYSINEQGILKTR